MSQDRSSASSNTVTACTEAKNDFFVLPRRYTRECARKHAGKFSLALSLSLFCVCVCVCVCVYVCVCV